MLLWEMTVTFEVIRKNVVYDPQCNLLRQPAWSHGFPGRSHTFHPAILLLSKEVHDATALTSPVQPTRAANGEAHSPRPGRNPPRACLLADDCTLELRHAGEHGQHHLAGRRGCI